MNPDDILFAPIEDPWRDQCREIAKYIAGKGNFRRRLYPVNRLRPTGALSLVEFLEAYHQGQSVFWRVEYPDDLIAYAFSFDGIVSMVDPVTCFPPWPTYNEHIPHLGSVLSRSIEDANLISNTYTHYYIFNTHGAARDAIAYLTRFYP